MKEITTSSNDVFKDSECTLAGGIELLGNPIRETAESIVTAKQTADS
jgi:hypothetical protein